MEGPPPHHQDPYFRLRHPPATPEEERCRCADAPPLVLKGQLQPNPLTCFACGLEVDPAQVALPPQLVDDIAAWRDVHDSLYLLWLDSQEFEAWAFGQLKDPRNAVHERGLKLIAKLATHRPTYYWWFTDQLFEKEAPLPACPRCQSELEPAGQHRLCTLCRVLIAS